MKSLLCSAALALALTAAKLATFQEVVLPPGTALAAVSGESTPAGQVAEASTATAVLASK